MPDQSSNNKRIARNTILLYIRMIFLMLVSLYTSRVILQVLGVEDYGIYNVVGGFVALFGFLNGAVSSSTSRYITFALGKGDIANLKKVFSTCVLTHGVIALIVLLLAETLGLWFVINKLVIPGERFSSAMWVYQCSIISSIVMIMSVPYNSDIIAHEKMSAFAYISIIEACAKLGVVYILLIGNVDKLMLYAVLLLVIQLAVRLIYTSYCARHFEESKFHFIWDKSLFKEIFSFAGWNLWGSLAVALMGQGLNIVLNMFFGPVVNASRGIAVQVESAVRQFAGNFQMALNPQITKNYAVGNLSAMHILVERSAKFTFILIFCLSLPIILEVEPILTMWLGVVPDHAMNFVSLCLVINIFEAMANPFVTSVSATGNVKIYQSVVGGILILIVPLAYLVLRLGGNPESVFITYLSITLVAFAVRMLIARKLTSISLRKFAVNALGPCALVALISVPISIGVKLIMPSFTGSFVVVAAIVCLIVLLVSYVFGLSRNERLFINDKVLTFARKMIR